MTAHQAAAKLNAALVDKRRALTALVEFRACQDGDSLSMLDAVNALVSGPYRVVAVFDGAERYVSRFAVAAR